MTCNKLVMVWLMLYTSLAHSNGFILSNNEFSAEGTYRIKGLRFKNFRVRLVADVLREKTAEDILEFLRAKHAIVEKAYVPPVSTESDVTAVHEFSSATKHLTIVVSADGYVKKRFHSSYLLYAQDIDAGELIEPNDTIKLGINRPTKRGRQFQMNFITSVDKNDGKGFHPIEFTLNRYSGIYQ